MSTPAPVVQAAVVAPVVAPAPIRSPLPAPKVLVEGPTGTGKTHCIGTLVDQGIEVGFMAFEQGVEALYGYWTDRGLKVPDNLYVHEVKGPAVTFGDMGAAAKLVNQLSYETLIKGTDSQRSKYDQMVNVYTALNDFIDNKGRKLGPVDKWSTKRWLAMDGLTGLSYSAMNLFVGGRIAVDQKDWLIGQRNIENLLRQITTQCRCGYVLISHVEREPDLLKGSSITASTLGKALAPKLPPMFSDVILAKKQVGNDKVNWWWDTRDQQADLKTRNLPIASEIPPDFKLILDKWKSRGGLIEA